MLGQRTSKQIVIDDYLVAIDAFNAASKAFSEACQAVRNTIKGPDKFLVTRGTEHYLVTVDKDKDFEVEPIEIG